MSINIDPDTFIHTNIVIKGKITFGPGTIVHPHATIDAGEGEIIFGNNNIVEETCQIINRGSGTMNIGNDNIFEVGCKVEAVSVGNNNVFGVKSVVSSNVTITDGVVLGAACQLLMKEVVPPKTCVYGENNDRRTAETSPGSLKSHCEFLQTKLKGFSKAYQNQA